VRGEKEWQLWAQEHVDWEDNQTSKANSRIPYASTLQLSDNDDELIKVEDSHNVPFNFRF